MKYEEIVLLHKIVFHNGIWHNRALSFFICCYSGLKGQLMSLFLVLLFAKSTLTQPVFHLAALPIQIFIEHLLIITAPI